MLIDGVFNLKLVGYQDGAEAATDSLVQGAGIWQEAASAAGR
jgi:hypothetical protein